MQRLSLGTLVLILACWWPLIGAPPGPMTPLIWLGALWLPGAALWFPNPGNRFDRWWLPLGLGPVVFGIGICLGRLAGIPLEVCGGLTVSLAGAAFLWRLHRGTSADPASGDGSDRGGELFSQPWVLPLLLGILVFLLGVLPSLSHEPLRLRDDARLHLPVIQRILAGSFPPENPFLAGTPLAYFWFYHATLAGVARLSGLPLDLIPALFNMQALLVLLLALDRVARRFSLSPLARGATLAFLGLGLSPWGWMHYLYMQITHPDFNWALIQANGASALFPLLNPTDPRLAAALTKVAISNALPMSLALVALTVSESGDTRTSQIRKTVLLAGCLGFHLATGLLLIAGLGFRWTIQRVAPGGSGRPRFRQVLPLVLALAVTLPYVLAVVSARSGAAATPGWQGGQALKLHLSLVGLWIFGIVAIRHWWRLPESRGWLLTGVPALVLPFVVHLVDGNEYKGLFFLLVILSPLAGAGLARLVRNHTMVGLALILPFIPTPYLAARAYVQETPPGILTKSDRARVAAAGATLPTNAVLWRPDPGVGYSVYGVDLGRSFYVSDPYALQIMGQWTGEEARWRRGSLGLAATAAQTPLALGAAQERLGQRPLFPLITAADSERFPHLGPALARMGFRPVATTGHFIIYGIRPPP